ncbi:MAG: hypothetical protein VKO39_00255 [Cyanobacteriota bacterium]|nr:hypothetical protein [Cyanobacteriota bacterium]
MVVLTRRSPTTPQPLAALPLTLLCGLVCALPPAMAQQGGYGQTLGTSPMEQQMYNYDPGSGSRPGGSSAGLNPANPLDLINKIRKGSAMDDATPPGDAVDQALKALEAQSQPQPQPAAPVGPLVTAPQPAGGATAATP